MQFAGEQLRGILLLQTEPVSLYNERGTARGMIGPMDAAIHVGTHVGIGNKRRIRFIRPMTASWRGVFGNSTTQCVRVRPGDNCINPVGVVLGHRRTFREHKPLPTEK